MNVRSRRFLFTMWEGGGTIPPMLGVARRLLTRGHEVRVLADPTVEDDALASGCSFSPWRRAPHRTSLDPEQDLLRDWEVSNPFAMLRRVRDVFIAEPSAGFAVDTLDEIEAFGADALIPDFMLFGSIIAAQAADLPVAPLVPGIWMLPTPGSPAIGPGFAPAKNVLERTRNAVMVAVANRLFNGGLPALNAARAVHGLAPLSSFYDQVLDTERILVLTSAEFDFASPTVPGNVRYVGPILDDPSWAEPWISPWSPEDERPLVLVAFSSTFQDQGPLLRRVVHALSSLPVRAVVTLGQMLGADEVEATENVAVVASAPHSLLLEEASVVVTHCGHGTTMKALAAGVPMVCIPMGRDQNDNAARVVHHGAGVRLSPRASADRIGAAVQDVLGDDRFRSEAAQLATAIASERNRVDVADEVESLTENGKRSERLRTTRAR
jgi:MGT family glycosyltransferase